MKQFQNRDESNLDFLFRDNLDSLLILRERYFNLSKGDFHVLEFKAKVLSRFFFEMEQFKNRDESNFDFVFRHNLDLLLRSRIRYFNLSEGDFHSFFFKMI